MSNNAVLRAPMSPVVREWRAYFGPVDRARNLPTVFDPARDGLFDSEAPPSPWIDAGWIENFARTQNTRFASVRSGPKGATTAQCRTELDARVEVDFRQWGKLQMALAGASEHMNVLAEATAATGSPSGGDAAAAIAVQTGSSAIEIIVGVNAVGLFNIGDLVAVDIDYIGQTGYVGTGISAAYVKPASGLASDYIRRVTFNVSRVTQKTATSLILAQPLIGGGPAASAKVQRVLAFVDREGGSFTPEWSGVFLQESESGARVCLYYPRLQPCASARESLAEIVDPLPGTSGSLRAVGLHASFIALPYADPNDGEPVVCWRSYFPANNAAVY